MDFFYLHHILKKSVSSFSSIRNGLGFGLTILGSLFFLLTFKRNLHTLVAPVEKQLPQKSHILRYLHSPFLISCFLLVVFIMISFFSNVQNIYFSYILHLISVAFVHILLPKYYISQDPILRFYVSVYHHHPPPVLSWQLPENIDPDVKLIVANLKNE